MDHLKALTNQLLWRVWALLLLGCAAVAGVWYLIAFFELETPESWLLIGASAVAITYVLTLLIVPMVLAPLKLVRQAILHVNSKASTTPAPDLEKNILGKEMVSALSLQVYDMASRAGQAPAEHAGAETPKSSEHFLRTAPLPILSLDANGTVRFLSDAALQFLGDEPKNRQKYIGKNINDVLNLTFPNENTYEAWLKKCQESVVTATTTWNRVRLVDQNGKPRKEFDLAASFSKGAGDSESVLILFDHSEAYMADDQQISFVALAVHELRTPLTIMRGYIEVFEDELGPKLTPELTDFMHKMHASAQQLTAFVGNILNVARVEEDQLILQLRKENMKDIMDAAVADLELRAHVHGKHIDVHIADDIPPVAADRISLHEIINNLVDNAIKYSPKTDTIKIDCRPAGNGMVEVSVQDFGIGIPETVINKLFDKFYRSHRSRIEIGGTGLGLYLCKALVTAHGGNIWVKSKEGEGSTFTFSIEAFDEQRHGAEAATSDGIMRGAHGWIKNHSMYRQ